MVGPLLKVQMWFCVAGARDSAPYQKWAQSEGFVAFSKTMAGVGRLKRVCKDACRVAGAVQETCSSEMLGPRADFLRGIRSGRSTLHSLQQTAPQLQLQLHYTNYTTIQLQRQLQLHYTTLIPAVVGEVTAATIATAPKNTAPSTFRSISGFALPSVIHNKQPLL